MGTLQEAAGGTAERVMDGEEAVISKGLGVARDRMSAASWTQKKNPTGHKVASMTLLVIIL